MTARALDLLRSVAELEIASDAIVECRGHGQVSGGGELFGHRANVFVDAENLLQDDHRAARRGGGARDVHVVARAHCARITDDRFPGGARTDVLAWHQARSTMAVTPMPPAVHTEISPRRARASLARSFASAARMRPPVAAKGWPRATLPPLTLILAGSMAPSGARRPSRSRQNSGDSQAFSVHSIGAAKAPCTS